MYNDLARLNYEANRLNSNLLQLLLLYQLHRDPLPVTIDEYYLTDITEGILLKKLFFTEQRNVQIDIEQNDTLCWYFDYDLVFNLLNDAVSNALRYCTASIALNITCDQQKLCVEVHDDGRDFMRHCDEFDMNSADLANSHTGLGIFFAKLIAAAHISNGICGTVPLTNSGRFGGGVFRLTLP
jgi:K+-sensing histidine kinase KdpD